MGTICVEGLELETSVSASACAVPVFDSALVATLQVSNAHLQQPRVTAVSSTLTGTQQNFNNDAPNF